MKDKFTYPAQFELWAVLDKDGKLCSETFCAKKHSKIQKEMLQKEVDEDGGSYHKIWICTANSWEDAKKKRQAFQDSMEWECAIQKLEM